MPNKNKIFEIDKVVMSCGTKKTSKVNSLLLILLEIIKVVIKAITKLNSTINKYSKANCKQILKLDSPKVFKIPISFLRLFTSISIMKRRIKTYDTNAKRNNILKLVWTLSILLTREMYSEASVLYA